MRCVVKFVASAALALLATACDPYLGGQYLREGIGPNLATPEAVNIAELQNAYLELLCVQASPVIAQGGDPACIQARLGPPEWTLIVQAGMNDIDRRCDAYLTWLDERKRTSLFAIKELSSLAASTAAILRATEAGPNSFALVGIAFGIAIEAFTNVNSRLLLEVPHSTVQTIVLGHQNEYRERVKDFVVNNKPAAIYLLRGYLRTCLPFSIEMSITNTIAVLHRVGPEGLTNPPLVNPNPVGTPLRATQKVEQPKRKFVSAPPEIAQFFEETLSETEAEHVLNALCLDKNASNGMGDVDNIKTLIAIYQSVNTQSSGKLKRRDRELIVRQTNCGDAKNYYERVTFANTESSQKRTVSAAAVKALVEFLNRSSRGEKLDPAATLVNARTKIAAVRSDPMVVNELKIRLPAQFTNQVTPDLMTAVRRLPAAQ